MYMSQKSFCNNKLLHDFLEKVVYITFMSCRANFAIGFFVTTQFYAQQNSLNRNQRELLSYLPTYPESQRHLYWCCS